MFASKTIFWLAIIALVAGMTPPPSASSPPLAAAQNQTPPNFKIAFIGDQGLGPDAVAVLNLVKSEGAEAVLHSGDLEYTDNPLAWEAQVNSVLGPDFPYFVTIGNHDEAAWKGPNGYQQKVVNRFNRLGISWTGDLGVQSTFHYKGLFFVQTAPGISSGFDAGNSDIYIRDQLAADASIWSICTWHKNMRLMQVGGKPDETGWGVYEEARKGGALVATAHEHSYSRTHLLNSFVNQTVGNTSNTLSLTRGNSFAFVSGLGGHSVRPQVLSGNWWASISASTCLSGDPVCQPNGRAGALFAIFNLAGQPNKALFYFKDISGRVIDSFIVFSNVELPMINGLLPARAQSGAASFLLNVSGENFADNAVVQWNYSDRPTTHVSSTQLTATISAADIASAGTAAVTVSGPGGVSNSTTFTIEPGPVSPVITTLQPASVEAGGDSFTVTVDGNNFLNTSVVRWNGENRATSFISPQQLTATILPADISAAGTVAVTVANPDRVSAAISFTISPPSLVLFTEPNSDRAIALDSVFMLRDPFVLSSPLNLNPDRRTRIMIFSPNLSLLPSDGTSSVSAQARDAQGRIFPVAIEYVGKTPQYDWLTEIVIKLPDDVGAAKAIWLRIGYRNAFSNQAMINLR
jgi:Calcineurin-like phosphoesterase